MADPQTTYVWPVCLLRCFRAGPEELRLVLIVWVPECKNSTETHRSWMFKPTHAAWGTEYVLARPPGAWRASSGRTCMPNTASPSFQCCPSKSSLREGMKQKQCIISKAPFGKRPRGGQANDARRCKCRCRCRCRFASSCPSVKCCESLLPVQGSRI